MLVDLPCLREAPVEALRDAAGAVRIAGKQYQRGVVAGFGAKVDLRHGR
jgi:hypothetical protein